MAEDHRRVEPRGIIGTGMATDPERIRELADEQERKKRSWRSPPEKGFGDVLKDAPARGELEDDDAPKKKPRHPSGAPDEAALGALALAPTATPPGPSAASSPASSPATPAALPRAPRDPREAVLRKLLETAPRKSPVTSTDTPPTGSHARKPK